MDKGEYLDNLDGARTAVNKYLTSKGKFCKYLSSSLYQFITDRKTLSQNNKTTIDELKLASSTCASETFEAFQHTLATKALKEPYKPNRTVPTVISEQQGKEELSQLLADIPESEHTYATEIHWEAFKLDNQTFQFEADLHNIVKKALVAYFESEIVNFDSDSFRRLDEHTYSMATFPFTEKVYELLDCE